jgi:hypothetical protein
MRIRNILYVKMFIAETMDRDRPLMLSMVEGMYYPALVKAFAAWEKSNGRKLSKEDMDLLLKDLSEVFLIEAKLHLHYISRPAW